MKSLPFILISLVSLLFFTSCKKEDTLLGKDGLDDNVFLDSEAIDTFSIETSMFVEDSLISSNLTTALLGSFNDPVLGKCQSEIYTQFQLAGLSPDFGDLSSIVIDSFVLGLEYRGYYGSLDPQTFEVYQLQEDLHIDSTYYSFQTKAVSATNLVQTGKGTLTPDPINPTVIDDIEVESQLRLHLDTNFAKSIINETVNNPSSFTSNENFNTYFRGLNIKVNNPGQSSGKGAMLYFNLNDPLSKLTIYYTQDGVKRTFDLLINDECADFNHIIIENSAKVQEVIDNPSSGNKEFYIQANKSRAVVKFTTINNIPKNAIIQYASLELPVSFYNYDAFYPSTELSVSTRISATNNQLYLLGDENNNLLKPNFNNFDKNYVINVRKYVQDVVNGTISNEGLFLSPSKMLTSSERIVFNGVNTLNKKKPKLKIIYTIY